VYICTVLFEQINDDDDDDKMRKEKKANRKAKQTSKLSKEANNTQQVLHKVIWKEHFATLTLENTLARFVCY